MKKPDLIEVLVDDVEVNGGGVIAFDSKKQTLKFSSHSTAYGKFDKSLLEEFCSNCSEIYGAKIEIET